MPNEKISSVSDDKNYVVGEDFDEDAFIAEMMAENRSDETNGRFFASDIDESVFDSCEVPDLSLFKYGLNITSDGVVISDYTGKNIINLKIPDEIEGVPVTEIEKLGSHEEVKAIFIPDSVKTIEPMCFFYWENLEFVHLPTSLKIIRNSLFENCEKLKTIKIPENVKKIEKSAFSYSGIKSIDIPNNVTELEKSVFKSCKNLEKITLPKSLANLPNEIFEECTSLKEIDIPNGVTAISDYAFAGCTSLQNVNIPNTVTVIKANSFAGCSSLSELDIPDSVVKIENAFTEYGGKSTGLVSLELPDSVVDLGIYATYDDERCSFFELENLEHLKISNSLEILSGSLFHNHVDNTKLTKLKIVNIPTSCKTIYESEFLSGLTALKELKIPDSLTHIKFVSGSNAFKDVKLSLKTQARLRQLGYEGEF